MNIEFLSNNWALLAAIVPAMIFVVVLARHLISRTATGQLRKVLEGHHLAMKNLKNAEDRRRKSERRLEQLRANAEKIKPRLLQKSMEDAEDSLALEKIASDRALITANHVRQVILEEFPPSRQQKLRAKHLPQDVADGRPVSF